MAESTAEGMNTGVSTPEAVEGITTKIIAINAQSRPGAGHVLATCWPRAGREDKMLTTTSFSFASKQYLLIRTSKAYPALSYA
ncbi:MAG: hypothetical protein WBG04_21340 [Haloferula sp.]